MIGFTLLLLATITSVGATGSMDRRLMNLHMKNATVTPGGTRESIRTSDGIQDDNIISDDEQNTTVTITSDAQMRTRVGRYILKLLIVVLVVYLVTLLISENIAVKGSLTQTHAMVEVEEVEEVDKDAKEVNKDAKIRRVPMSQLRTPELETRQAPMRSEVIQSKLEESKLEEDHASNRQLALEDK